MFRRIIAIFGTNKVWTEEMHGMNTTTPTTVYHMPVTGCV